MAEQLSLIDPHKLKRNPDNPRLIFRQDELEALEESISSQGILVPLTVYKDGGSYRLLDGERRWRCAINLGLSRVPVIVQPKPEKLQNIMMMFAIHNARRDWDPLPTAIKLQQLEHIFTEQQKRAPTEKELAELASMGRGEVRRLKKLLALPLEYRALLLKELEKPRAQQEITADLIIETTKGVEALSKRKLIHKKDEDRLRKSIITKFKSKVINNTVAPRKLARIARAVERGDVKEEDAIKIVSRLINDRQYSIDSAYQALAHQAELVHQLEQLIERVTTSLEEYLKEGSDSGQKFRPKVEKLEKLIRKYLSR